MTSEAAAGPGGTSPGTNGEGPSATIRLAIAALFLFGVLQATVNALSGIDDRAGSGVADWEVWSWEFSSLIAWLCIWPFIWIAVRQFAPPRFSWPMTIAIHAMFTIPASMLHVALMIGLRKLVYWAAGASYDLQDSLLSIGYYEYRKDAATYVLGAILFVLLRVTVGRKNMPVDALSDHAVLAVRDGAVVHHVPLAQIEYVESAGNYVSIPWQGRSLLHRATLTNLESMLRAHGFVRIHRQRLARRAAIRTIESLPSGDFVVTMESGGTVKGSRRYRL